MFDVGCHRQARRQRFGMPTGEDKTRFRLQTRGEPVPDPIDQTRLSIQHAGDDRRVGVIREIGRVIRSGSVSRRQAGGLARQRFQHQAHARSDHPADEFPAKPCFAFLILVDFDTIDGGGGAGVHDHE